MATSYTLEQIIHNPFPNAREIIKRGSTPEEWAKFSPTLDMLESKLLESEKKNVAKRRAMLARSGLLPAVESELKWVDENLSRYDSKEHAEQVKANIVKRYHCQELRRKFNEMIKCLEDVQ